MDLQELERLAADARPRPRDPNDPKTFGANDEEKEGDWGSERQIDAQNAFGDAVEAIVPADVFAEFEAYCLKATSDERIDEGLRIARPYVSAAAFTL